MTSKVRSELATKPQSKTIVELIYTTGCMPLVFCPENGTFVPLPFVPIVALISVLFTQDCARVVFGFPLTSLHRCFSQICLLRPQNWSSKSVRQSEENR